MPVQFLVSVLIIAATTMNGAARAEPLAEIVASSDVLFQPLNPARGEASPRAGVLWGDIRKDMPSGALINFTEGFSSPPHIHNITYRAVVISGAVHNDDPDAGRLWMGPGSFWTQPAGESHITAAGRGGKATAFLQILEGPYLVQAADEAFDNGERPVNVAADNVVWLDSADVNWIEQSGTIGSAERAEIGFLWGSPQDDQKNGTFLRLPADLSGELRGNGSWLRAVVIRGQTSHQLSGETNVSYLEPGSYFGSKGGTEHRIACGPRDECLIYISTEGKYHFVQM